MNRNTMQPSDDQILLKTYDYKAQLINWNPDPRYGMVTDYYGAWSVRLGAKLSF